MHYCHKTHLNVGNHQREASGDPHISRDVFVSPFIFKADVFSRFHEERLHDRYR